MMEPEGRVTSIMITAKNRLFYETLMEFLSSKDLSFSEFLFMALRDYVRRMSFSNRQEFKQFKQEVCQAFGMEKVSEYLFDYLEEPTV